MATGGVSGLTVWTPASIAGEPSPPARRTQTVVIGVDLIMSRHGNARGARPDRVDSACAAGRCRGRGSSRPRVEKLPAHRQPPGVSIRIRMLLRSALAGQSSLPGFGRIRLVGDGAGGFLGDRACRDASGSDHAGAVGDVYRVRGRLPVEPPLGRRPLSVGPDVGPATLQA